MTTKTQTRTRTNKHAQPFTKRRARTLCTKVLSAKSMRHACEIIEATAKRTRGYWRRMLRKLARELSAGETPFAVFTEGNTKLPFYAFSVLPEFTCPGAGACLEWCYSFRAWRYPAAFCRQLQNTLLLKHRKRSISDAFLELPHAVTIRLYVDGDVDSIQTLAFWFRLLGRRQDVSAYGYSKSWQIFADWNAQGLAFPTNYKLNLSSGSKYDENETLKTTLAGLPITRGEFVAVATGSYAKGFVRFDDANYHKEVRETAREQYATKRVFSCPGKCGECLPNGVHACGSDSMQDVLIAIGEHN